MHCFQWTIVLLLVSDANAYGQLTILYTPSSIQFLTNYPLLEENLKDIYLASLGLTSNETSTFRGMKIVNPFDTPEALIEIYVNGIPDFGNLFYSAEYYSLIMNKYTPSETFNTIKSRIINYLGSMKPDIVKIDFSSKTQLSENVHIFGDVKPQKPAFQNLQYLKYNQEKDSIFLSELEYIKAIIAKINSGTINANGYIDYYKIKIRNIHELAERYGKNSFQVNEAKQLLVKVLTDLKDAFVKVYKGSVLIVVITTDEIRGREPRQGYPDGELSNITMSGIGSDGEYGGFPETTLIPQPIELYTTQGGAEESGGSGGGLGGVDRDDPDFPLRFNLLFWFGLFYVYILMAAVYFVMRMEPDKDSIIYRMSNVRAKKEH